LQEIPPEIGLCTDLEVLYLEKNQLREIPPEIGNLTKLQDLIIPNNNLQDIPREIEQMSSLTRLELDHNQLQSIPPAIARIPKLAFLSLTNNKLQNLPVNKGELYWYPNLTNSALKRALIEVIPPSQLEPEWLLIENNSHRRRMLIQRIGYARICQKLPAIELDRWKEYTLLKIELEELLSDRRGLHREATICLLKMNCPTTGDIHVLRVPSTTISARTAIRWINWGIDPEEFAAQT